MSKEETKATPAQSVGSHHTATAGVGKHWKEETDPHILTMQRENYHRSTPEYAAINDRIKEVQHKAAHGEHTGVDKPVTGKTNAAVQGEIEAAKIAGAGNATEPVQGTGQENAVVAGAKQPKPKAIEKPKSEKEAVAHKEIK